MKQVFRANSSALWHSAVRFVAEIPFSLRALIAPEGQMVRNHEVVATGWVVRCSGDTEVILTRDGSIVFPNGPAGDGIRKIKKTRQRT